MNKTSQKETSIICPVCKKEYESNDPRIEYFIKDNGKCKACFYKKKQKKTLYICELESHYQRFFVYNTYLSHMKFEHPNVIPLEEKNDKRRHTHTDYGEIIE